MMMRIHRVIRLQLVNLVRDYKKFDDVMEGGSSNSIPLLIQYDSIYTVL